MPGGGKAGQLADLAASCRRLAETGMEKDSGLDPASQLRLEFEAKLVGMRHVRDISLPAISEWLRLNLAAWKALQVIKSMISTRV